MDEISLKLTLNPKKERTYVAISKGGFSTRIMQFFSEGKDILVIIENQLFLVGQIEEISVAPKHIITIIIKPSGTVIKDESFPKRDPKADLLIIEPLTNRTIAITPTYEIKGS